MTIEVTDFSVTPIQAQTGDQISVNAQIDCTNYWYTCGSIVVSIKVNGQQVSSETVSVGAWSGFVPYTKKITMPSTNAFIEVSFHEENKISRQASVVNVSPLPAPSINGNGNGYDLVDNNMLVGMIAIFVVGIGIVYIMSKE